METVTKGFGYLIAFVLPGLVGLGGVGCVSPGVAAWLCSAAKADASVGGFLFAVCVAIGAGVFLGGVRDLTLSRWMPKPPKTSRNPESEEIYQNLLAQHFMYFQFYGNMMPAALAFFVCWIVGTKPPFWTVLGWGAAGILIEVVLFCAARQTLTRLQEKILHLEAGERMHV